MNPDWQNILRKLGSYTATTHKMRPPCPKDRVEQVEAALGEMPTGLVEMLSQFNGARLFTRSGGPLVSIFGISTIPPLPPLEWAADWYIDKFTPAWRSAGEARQTDWVIAMMNYGGLIILDDNENVREWNTAQGEWETTTWSFAGWFDEILTRGELFMREG